MIDHLDLYVIFMDFPKPIKNTQSLHCVGRVSFHVNILTWPKNAPLFVQLSLRRMEACLAISQLNIPTPVTTRICQAARSGNWNVKSDLCLFTFVTAGVTLGLSQHIHNKNKIRARPSDIILSILPVTWSERELKIKRDLTRLRAGRIKWGCSDSK